MPSAHPRLNTLPAGLFAGLQSFRELEERIAALPDGGLQRGDALEVFVEAHLQTSPLFQVEELWLVNQIPLSVRRQLKLPSDSKGIDGVYRMSDGTLAPYQVKFRQGRPQVGVGDTASFFMLTESAQQRILISNCDRYAKEIRDRKDLRIIGGLYFDELAAEDFARIDSWLRNKPVIPSRARPLRPHQTRAVDAIVSRLRSDARATAVMPCGTGKTLVGLRVVEELKTRNVVVFVPSLALLAQLLEDWAKDTTWGRRFRYLCVCSQPAVSAEVDRWELNPTDVHFPVNTDPAIVRDFLKHNGGEDTVRVIFSTYQSAKKVADGLPRGFRFDVGLFDEAHKTTEGGFTLALHDENLPIDRRLFLTATPRHIDIKHRDKQGDFKVVSMDDPEVYGQPAFSQSFPEAVEEGIICDYRVVVATVDRSEVSEYAERYGITLVKGDENATRWVASQIAVTRAIEETGASKVITFHSRVRQAKDFASQTSRGIGQFLPDFGIGHVNGTQPVTDRKDVLSGFRGNGKMLVTNARCLTEGVDLPAVDAVVFNNPRRSKVDIVQAVGRAMRKPPHSKKELGYVVVPVLLEHSQTEDLEEACRRTEWEDLVAILAALRDQDSRLDKIIREAQEAAGRGEVFNPRPFGDRITILGRPQIALSTIQRHVGAVILERLGQTWDYRYGQLEAHKAEHGHFRVSQHKLPQLATWVVRQRQFFKKGILSRDRKARLDAIGFVWDENEAAWDASFAELEDFRLLHGHVRVSRNDNPRLAQWMVGQRQGRKHGRLSGCRISRLESIGFVWDENETAWNEAFARLQAFAARHGHSNVPAKYKLDPTLGKWVSHQRKAYRSGKLFPKREEQLASLGFTFDPLDAHWHDQLRELIAFKARHGHCNVPQRYKENPLLGAWVSIQRAFVKRPDYAAERKRLLDELGFDWDPLESAWLKFFEALKLFKAEHGHLDVPRDYPAFPKLNVWCSQQRTRYRRGQLEAPRIALLEGLGFPWMKKPAKSLSMLDEVRLFKRANGHCNVPAQYSENPRLGTWVTVRRKMWRNGTIDAQELDVLNSLGFVWDPTEEAWSRNIEALKNFKRLNGHCNVPRWYPENQPLATWLQAQRKAKRAGKLLASREAQLQALGVQLPQETQKTTKHQKGTHTKEEHSGKASKRGTAKSIVITAVAQYGPDGKQIAIHPSISSAANHARCSMENLRQVLVGKRATAGGYRWISNREDKPAPRTLEPLSDAQEKRTFGGAKKARL